MIHYVFQITIGNAATESCAGEAGVPNNVRASFVSESTIQFAWDKPQCDETYGPIDGYEYAVMFIFNHDNSYYINNLLMMTCIEYLNK